MAQEPVQLNLPIGCSCNMVDRGADEEQRDWLKRCMCPYHWSQTGYYQERTGLEENIMQGELLDLIRMMPDFQAMEIAQYITSLVGLRMKLAFYPNTDVQ